METSKLDFPFEVKQLGASGEIEGWASTYDIDLGKDKVLPGAFRNHHPQKQGRCAYAV
jgi:hypothetical protein